MYRKQKNYDLFIVLLIVMLAVTITDNELFTILDSGDRRYEGQTFTCYLHFDREFEMAGFEGLVNIADFERKAKEVLSKQAAEYYSSGAGREFSLRLNKSVFSKFRIRPRFMRDVSCRDLSTTILGNKISFPVGVSPTAMQKMAHPLGECANARAAAALGTIFILSTISTSSIEDIAEAAPNGIRWFQLYIYKDRDVTLKLVRRAEAAGFSALVLTVDAPMFGIRHADARNKFSLPSHLTMANFSGAKASVSSQGGSGINEYVGNMFDASITWTDVKWLKSITNLPIIAKGVLTGEDAQIAADLGVAGIIVSNHGARQVDHVPAPLEVLPEIVRAVGPQCEIYMDGGISGGTDVFMALARGAKMVFVGRPALWGLACGGQPGVEKVLNIIKTEFDSTMALTGCGNVQNIEKEMVVPAAFYHKL